MTILPTLSMRLMRRRILPVVLTIGAEAVLSCKGGDVAGGNPTIALAAQSVTLTATAQGANPAAQTTDYTSRSDPPVAAACRAPVMQHRGPFLGGTAVRSCLPLVAAPAAPAARPGPRPTTNSRSAGSR